MAEEYPVIPNTLDARSPEFVERRRQVAEVVADMRRRYREYALDEGRQSTLERHRARNKLSARERVDLLLDEDSPFLELCAFAGYEQENQNKTLIGGVGVVSGTVCMVTADVYTIAGGSISVAMVTKGARLAQIADENNLPRVNLTESGGANLTQQFNVFHRGGASFRNATRRSAARQPVITAVFGNATAGGAYTPGMSDHVVMVRRQSQAFLGGPPLVKMATHEVVDAESLGGADMHARQSGLCDYVVDSDEEAIVVLRRIVAAAHHRRRGEAQLARAPDAWRRAVERAPLYSVDELDGLAAIDVVRQRIDARQVLARIVDGSRMLEFKRDFGPTLVCGMAHIDGVPVGVLMNDGILFAEAARKGAQFIQLMNQRSTPLLFVHNITGFMVGRRYEEGGIIVHGSKMINAVSNSTVPAITIVVGASYGAGNYAMMGRAYEPRFMFAWPTARVSVMGGEQLAGVMETVARDQAAARKSAIDEEALARRTAMLRAMVDRDSTAYRVSSACYDDGIIAPRDTRAVVSLCLDICHGERVDGTTSWGVVRM